VSLGKACLQPFTTAQSVLDSGAGKALKNFSEHSTEAVETSARDFLDAQNDPDRGGQATGKLLTNLGLAVAPLPIPKRLWGLKMAEEAPKTPPELGGFPSKTWRTHFNQTRPTGQVGGKPEGIMEPLAVKDPVKLRAQIRQQESADLLAERGYKIRHRDQSEILGQKNPDYEMEGKIFDHYAPTSNNPDQIRKTLSKKFKEGQTCRAVVNLDGSPFTAAEVRQQLLARPVRGMQEVITIRLGEVEHIYP
jgi:hypothetical protein